MDRELAALLTLLADKLSRFLRGQRGRPVGLQNLGGGKRLSLGGRRAHKREVRCEPSSKSENWRERTSLEIASGSESFGDQSRIFPVREMDEHQS